MVRRKFGTPLLQILHPPLRWVIAVTLVRLGKTSKMCNTIYSKMGNGSEVRRVRLVMAVILVRCSKCGKMGKTSKMGN